MTAVDVPLPLGDDADALVELSALRREVGPLRVVAERAAYVTGPAECVEGDCEHPDGACPDVTPGHATYADLHARDGLERIIEDLLVDLADAAVAGRQVAPAELVAQIESAVNTLAYRLENLDDADRTQDRSLYRNIRDSVRQS